MLHEVLVHDLVELLLVVIERLLDLRAERLERGAVADKMIFCSFGRLSTIALALELVQIISLNALIPALQLM